MTKGHKGHKAPRGKKGEKGGKGDKGDNGTPTDIQALVKRDGTNPMTGNLDLGTHKIVNLTEPTLGKEAANKEYIDNYFLNSTGGRMNGHIDLNDNALFDGLKKVLEPNGEEIAIGSSGYPPPPPMQKLNWGSSWI